MFSTCIHCTAKLGRNEALASFPVGTRIAFDARQGRLWVVCRACERWNLSPLDERWEAIEEAERRFRDARLRVSTGEIGLARLREGLDLVRVGAPLRPEMAAWRYGDQFGRRRTRQLLITGAGLGAATAVFGAFVWAGVTAGVFSGSLGHPSMWERLLHGNPRQHVATIRGDDGVLLRVQRMHARMSALEQSASDAPFVLRLEHTTGTTLLQGDVAMRAAAQLFPTVNRFGGSRGAVQSAVRVLEDAGDPRAVLERARRTFGAKATDKRPQRFARTPGVALSPKRLAAIETGRLPGVLHALPLQERLALEMALHEESERRAMDGELAMLAAAWRDADVIAGIADDLFTTPAVDARLHALHERDATSDVARDDTR